MSGVERRQGVQEEIAAIKNNTKVVSAFMTAAIGVGGLLYTSLHSIEEELKAQRKDFNNMYAAQMVLIGDMSTVKADIQNLEVSKESIWRVVSSNKERITVLESAK